MKPLFQELHRWAGLPFVWGETDCVMVLADWVQRLHGVDPAADLRMAYRSAGECQRMTGFYTEPVALFDRLLTPLGIARTAAPKRGDIGIVMLTVDGRQRPHGAICAGVAWATKGEDSVTSYRPPQRAILAAWDMRYSDA